MKRRVLMNRITRSTLALALVPTFISLFISTPAQAQTASNTLRLWREGDAGERLNLRGRIVDGTGRPVEGARVNVRQADGTATYTEQYAGTMVTGKDGGYRMASVVPGQYTGNKHIHMTVEHADYWPVDTTVVFKGDNDDYPDAVPLEQSFIKGVLVWQGRYDVTLEKR